jgi:hypothetical protein
MAAKVAPASIDGPNNSRAHIKVTGSYARLTAIAGKSGEVAERAAPVNQVQQR